MTAFLKAKWHGVAALIWWLFGIGVIWAWGRYPMHEGLVICLLLGWLAPVLLLALSGLHRGSLTSRVCAILVIVTFVAFASVVLIPPLPNDGH